MIALILLILYDLSIILIYGSSAYAIVGNVYFFKIKLPNLYIVMKIKKVINLERGRQLRNNPSHIQIIKGNMSWALGPIVFNILQILHALIYSYLYF